MLLSLLASTAFASQLDLPPEELDALAHLVVIGEITTLQPRWASGARGGVETSAFVAVEQVIAGRPVGDLEIHLEGGALGLHRTVSSESPELQVDARYRLRLVPDERGRWRILGGDRGAELLADPPSSTGAPRYLLTGVSWAWEDLPVEDGFVLNAQSFAGRFAPAEVGAAWSLAVDIWNTEALANLYLPNDGTTDNLVYGGGDNGLNVTMFHGQSYGSALAAAVYNSVGNNLIDCDIRIYGRNLYGEIDWSLDPAGAAPNRFDMTHTIIHELGHCLGLGHSNDPAAIMYAYNGSGTGWERRHLHADDVAGIHAMYGQARVALDLDVTVRADAVEVSLTNGTGAPAVDVLVWVASDHPAVLADDIVEAGDLPPRSAADVVVPMVVGSDCDAGPTAALEVIAEDAAGNRWAVQTELALDCPEAPAPGVDPDDDGEGPRESRAGCGCRSAAPAGPLALPILALLWRRRRR